MTSMLPYTGVICVSTWFSNTATHFTGIIYASRVAKHMGPTLHVGFWPRCPSMSGKGPAKSEITMRHFMVRGAAVQTVNSLVQHGAAIIAHITASMHYYILPAANTGHENQQDITPWSSLHALSSTRNTSKLPCCQNAPPVFASHMVQNMGPTLHVVCRPTVRQCPSRVRQWPARVRHHPTILHGPCTCKP